MISEKWLKKSVSVFFTVALYTATVAHAGWIMEDADGTTTYLSRGKVKSVYDNEGVRFLHIVDATRNLITMIDQGSKTYGSGTPDDLCNTIKSFGESMKEQAMAGLSPEQRKMVEEQMKQFGEMMKSAPMASNPEKVNISIKKRGEGESIANHKTIRFTITVNGEKYGDLWLAADISLGKEEKKLGLHKVHAMLKRMESCMGMSNEDMGIMADPLDSPEYRKITENGLVMREVTYSGNFGPDAVTASIDIVKLVKKNIPQSEFSIPSGYRKVPLENLLKEMMGSQKEDSL